MVKKNMLTRRLLRLKNHKFCYIPEIKNFHDEYEQKDPSHVLKEKAVKIDKKRSPTTQIDLAGSFQQKYTIFKEEESPEIFDVEEERQRYQIQEDPNVHYQNEFVGLNLDRGLYGVFEMEDLVDVLRKESAEDIFVCAVPKELKYVDYLVVCSGRSYRHMLAMAEFVRRVYKMKRHQSDKLPKIEGKKSHDWMAMDLGNIALHIFSPKTRETYDLETLWSIGIEYDREFNKPPDPLVELFERHSMLLNEIKTK